VRSVNDANSANNIKYSIMLRILIMVLMVIVLFILLIAIDKKSQYRIAININSKFIKKSMDLKNETNQVSMLVYAIKVNLLINPH